MSDDLCSLAGERTLSAAWLDQRVVMMALRAVSNASKALSLGLLTLAADVLLADDLDNPPLPQITLAEAASQAGIRVALVDSGVNYLLPDINSRLARSVDEKLVGYDFWDMDELPFDSHPTNRGSVQRHGTQTASLLLKEAPFAELVPYRYPRPDMQRMADLIAHADKHGVRVIGMPLGGNLSEQWEAFESAAKAHPHILFVSSAGNNGRDIDQQPVYPAALALENMLVVTSADDFARVADGVNFGRVSVDYMVPAESLEVLRFDGSSGVVAGSSYAVPRVVALAARYLHTDPSLDASQLMQRIRQKFANGALPRQLGQGYLYDPLYDENARIRVVNKLSFISKVRARPSDAELPARQLPATPTPSASQAPPAPPAHPTPSIPSESSENSAPTTPSSPTIAAQSQADATAVGAAGNNPNLTLPLQILVLDERWQADEVIRLLDAADDILSQCGIAFASTDVELVEGPDYIRDLETGAARTLFDAVRASGAKRKLTVVFASDTRMTTAFDAEAFGRGNTRQRSWMTDSVWLTLALEDRAIALAHELFHVLVNSGQHSDVEGSLMLARTTGNNTLLTPRECSMARKRSLELGLVDIN